jgi:hypothetical protein
MRVFLDDDRNHGENGWTMVRTVPALMRLLDVHGAEVTHLSFDNDLRQPLEGWEGVRDILERLLDRPDWLPSLASVNVHSLNEGAAERMISKLENAVRVGVLDVVVTRMRALDGIHPLASEDPRTVDVFD